MATPSRLATDRVNMRSSMLACDPSATAAESTGVTVSARFSRPPPPPGAARTSRSPGDNSRSIGIRFPASSPSPAALTSRSAPSTYFCSVASRMKGTTELRASSFRFSVSSRSGSAEASFSSSSDSTTTAAVYSGSSPVTRLVDSSIRRIASASGSCPSGSLLRFSISPLRCCSAWLSCNAFRCDAVTSHYPFLPLTHTCFTLFRRSEFPSTCPGSLSDSELQQH